MRKKKTGGKKKDGVGGWLREEKHVDDFMQMMWGKARVLEQRVATLNQRKTRFSRSCSELEAEIALAKDVSK